MKSLYIPKLGDVLELAKPWTFTVYHEYRNKSLVALSGLAIPDRAREDWWKTRALGSFTFPAGAKLTVDRIYIRAGGEDFNSVTFRARDYTTDVRTGLKGAKEKVVRFWAKLDDVNTMKIT